VNGEQSDLKPSSPEPPAAFTYGSSTVLHEVYESELYIQHCISQGPGRLLSPLAFIRTLSKPKQMSSQSSSEQHATPSWLYCHIYTSLAWLTFRAPSQSVIFYSHINALHILDIFNGPYQMYAAMKYTPSSNSPVQKLPSWEVVSLASSLLIHSISQPASSSSATSPSQASLPSTDQSKKKTQKVPSHNLHACLDLILHVIVMTQLELTLTWNHISGLTYLWSSVGQLIPFIIGVGGAVLVLGRWIDGCGMQAG
jgi:hypothetical protein